MDSRPSAVRVAASQLGSDSAARFLSLIGLPPVLAFPTAFLAASRQPGGTLGVALLMLTGCIIPTVLTVALFRAGRTASLDLRERGERALPSAATAIGCAIAWLWLRTSGSPHVINELALGVAVQMALLAVITTRWKVSYHAASAGALVAVSSVHETPGLTMALLCFALSIGWARVYLRRHTPAQVFVGALTAAPIALLT